MTIGSKSFWMLCFAVALMQTAALAKIVVDRQTLLKTGREIKMQVLPVDPRDIMRGDYVTLGYGLTPMTLTEAQIDGPLGSIARNSPAFVTLHQGSENTWTVGKVSATYPNAVSAGDVVLRGRVSQRWDGGTPGTVHLNVDFGIEKFFVPEGTGKPIEQQVRDKKTLALVSVGPDGEAALKGLIIDGERLEDPPLF